MKIEEILKKRERIENLRFYIPLQSIRIEYAWTIVQRKSWYGLMKEDTLVLSPIYDDIQLLTPSLALLFVDGKCGVYDLEESQWLLELRYEKILPIDNKAIVEVQFQGLKGLYSFSEKRFLMEISYDDLTHCDHCEYLWGRHDTATYFVHKDSGRVIEILDAEILYDTEKGMFVKDKRGYVCCYEESGISNRRKLREFVVQHRGRGILYNYEYDIKSIIDVYGNILNE